MMSVKKAILGLAVLGMFVALIPVAGIAQGQSQDNRGNILFILQDKVTRFDLPPLPPLFTALGLQVGTATGKISGVSITTFQFSFASFPSFTVNSRTGITDTDGDQIIFKVLGGGNFVLPSLVDPTLPDPTAAPTQVLAGLGGPVSGTYEVVATSGKYTRTFRLGQKFPFRAVGYNPNPASVLGDPFGAVYSEVLSNPVQ